jgi:hypothetical protein
MRLSEGLQKQPWLGGIVGGLLLVGQSAAAADLPVTPPPVLATTQPYYAAVDGLNAKIDGFAGSLANHAFYGSRASLSFPLGSTLGVQIDGAGGSLNNRDFGTIGGHLFARNPLTGLIGAYISYTNWNEFGGVDATLAAAEGELYWGRWTLQGIMGAEFGGATSQITTLTTTVPAAITTTTFVQSYDVPTRFFDQVNLKYYLTENWDAYVGHRYLGDKNAFAVGSELALPLGGGVMASAFVEGRIGTEDFEGVWAGLRFYFGGKDKPLIRRHREDDPIQWDTLSTITNNFSQSSAQSIQTIPPLLPVD